MDIEVKVYLDMVFIINFIYDFVGIYLTGVVSEEECNVRRYIKTALFYAMADILIILGEGKVRGIIYVIVYIVVEIVGIYISFGKMRIKKFMILMLLHTGVLFTMGGMVHMAKVRFLNVKSSIISHYIELIIVGVLVCLILKQLMPYLIKSIYYKERIYKVTLKLNGRTVDVNGLLDSGNALKEKTTGKGVTIVEKGMLKEFFNLHVDKIYIIPYRSIGKDEGTLYGIQVDELTIKHEKFEKKTKEAIIGIYNGRLSNDNRYNAILHSESLM